MFWTERTFRRGEIVPEFPREAWACSSRRSSITSAALKANPATFPTRGGAFMTTHWSVLRDLATEQEVAPERAQELLSQLCADYWPPLYRFVRFRGYSEEDAQDLTQGFFVYLLEKEVYKAPQPDRGQFRTFLLHLLKRYLGKADAHRRRQKRGGEYVPVVINEDGVDIFSVDQDDALLVKAPLDEQRAFDCDWAAALVERAMTALKAEYATGQRARVLEELRPFLIGGVGLPTYEEAAARLEVPMETLRSHLFRLRGSYRALLRAEVARTVSTDGEVESELRYLCRILLAST
jgi:RNA polymerase sigma factor (sigma-70 family)